MKSERIGRGQLAIGRTPAVLSHARITVGDSDPYDEIAYQLPGQRWEVLASHLDAAGAAALFDALDGCSAGACDELESAVAAIANGLR